MHLIKKRPSRPKYPSKRKHGNVPCAASDYCISYIGRHRSLVDLLVDLALYSRCQERCQREGMRSQSPLLHVTLTVDDAGQRAQSTDCVPSGCNFGCGLSKVCSRACAIFSSLICISPDSLAPVCFATEFSWHGNGAYSRGGGAMCLGVRVRCVR